MEPQGGLLGAALPDRGGLSFPCAVTPARLRWLRMILSAIKSTLKHLMVLLGCVHMTCGPQGALQAVAWVSMLASYSLENGVARGVVDTFSGDRPCGMCLKIADTDFGNDGSSEAPNPERRNHSPSLLQEWQAARSTHFAPPAGRMPATCGARPPAAIAGSSRGPAGPDTPPPRAA